MNRKDKDIERLVISVIIAVLIHLLLFFVFPVVFKFEGEKVPQYSGPVFVNLEEVPALGKTVVKKSSLALEKSRAKEPLKRSVSVKGEEGQEGTKTAVKEKTENKTSGATVSTGRSRSVESSSLKPVNPVNPITSGMVGGKSAVPYGSTEKNSSAPGLETTSKPAFPQSGRVYENKNPEETAGTKEKKSGKGEKLALSESIYSKLDKLLKEKNSGISSDKNTGTVSANEIASAKTSVKGEGENIQKSPGEVSERVSGPNIQWEEPSQRRVPISMPVPKIPKWVGKQGLTLKVTVSFELLPEGIIKSLKIVDSSGYSDVDSAVVEALRHWRFEAVSGTKVVRGKITYIIKPR